MSQHGFFFPGRASRIERRQDRRADRGFFASRRSFLPDRASEIVRRPPVEPIAPKVRQEDELRRGFAPKADTLNRVLPQRPVEPELSFSGMQGLTGGSVFQRTAPLGDVAPRLPPQAGQLRAFTNFLESPRDEGSVLGSAFSQLTTDRGVDPNLLAALEEVIGTRGEQNPILGDMLNAIFFQMPQLQGAQLFTRPGEVNQGNLSAFMNDFGFANRAV